MMADFFGSIYRSQSGSSGGGNTFNPRQVMLNTMGQQITMDWMMKAVLDGAAYQIKAGTISAPVTGDGTGITDTAAEMAADVASGTTIIPVEALTSIGALTGDAGEGAVKSVATVSSSGTAFTPLPLRSGGPGATSTARVQATGAVTVTAELVTTTLTHHAWASETGATAATDTANAARVQLWRPVAAPILVGARSLYLQVAISTYWAHMDYIELDSDVIAR